MAKATPDDFVGSLEKLVGNTLEGIDKLADEMLNQLRPFGSERVDPQADFEVWAMEDDDQAKKEWIKQKARLYGLPRAVAMFLEREKGHEGRMEKELSERGFPSDGDIIAPPV